MVGALLGRADGNVIPTQGGYINHVFRKVLTTLGLPHMRLHDLRGTFLTKLAKSCDVKTLQSIAGHADCQTTLRYYVQSPESRKLEALQSAFGVTTSGEPKTSNDANAKMS